MLEVCPTTAGLPNCRVTSGAWLVRPPRLVRMPLAAKMPPYPIRLGFGADQDHVALLGLGPLLGRVGVEGNSPHGPRPATRSGRSPATRRARRGILPLALRSNCGCRK